MRYPRICKRVVSIWRDFQLMFTTLNIFGFGLTAHQFFVSLKTAEVRAARLPTF